MSLLACKHACMPSCALRPAKSPTISLATTAAQSTVGCLDGQDACLNDLVACADPDFTQALYCTFQFERPQRLKAVMLSKTSEGSTQNLGVLSLSFAAAFPIDCSAPGY